MPYGRGDTFQTIFCPAEKSSPAKKIILVFYGKIFLGLQLTSKKKRNATSSGSVTSKISIKQALMCISL